MKKYISLSCLLLSIVFLVGCSWTEVKSKLSWLLDSLISADQQNEQWFVLTSEMVYERWYPEANGLKLRGMKLTSVPNLCVLLKPEDHSKVWQLDLSNNLIRIVNQDLTCLTNLKILNLSYNQIELVKDLGALPNLVDLKLQKNKLEETNNLPELPALQSLNLWFNNLKETIWLDKYQNLEVLELYHNQIESVVGIENITKLKELKVEFNNIKDFNFVDTLQEQWLELMTAKWNEIKDGLLDELKAMNDEYIESLKSQFELWQWNDTEE